MAKLHIRSSGPDLSDQAVIAVLAFDRQAHELEDAPQLPVRSQNSGAYLDLTTVEVPGAPSIQVRGGYHPDLRSLAFYVVSEGQPVLTLFAFCPPVHQYSPVAIARLPSGHVLQFMMEAEG